ncbi:MAG: hypothetical protein IAG13_19890 [Deltaproteobacteria bacterium]|nr:hypothetical protein [Nannocystaceae bacterium]
MSKSDDGQGFAVAKGALLALGGLAAIGIGLALLPAVFGLLKLAMIVGVIAGAGYLGYRAFGKTKALGEAKDRKMLSSADFDRRMRELDQVDRQLDKEIGRR